MDTPESTKRATNSPSSSSVQDSPFFNFVSNLSPINPINVGNAADITLPSPQLVFKSPNINLPRKLDLLRRCQMSTFAEKPSCAEDGRAASCQDIIVPSSSAVPLPIHQLMPCVQKEHYKEDSPKDHSSSDQSSCVDGFLAYPVDDSDSRTVSIQHLKQAAELPKSTLVVGDSTAGPHLNQDAESPGITQDESRTCNKHVKSKSKDKEIEVQPYKPPFDGDYEAESQGAASDLPYMSEYTCTGISQDLACDYAAHGEANLENKVSMSREAAGLSTSVRLTCSTQAGSDQGGQGDHFAANADLSCEEHQKLLSINAKGETHGCLPLGHTLEVPEQELTANQIGPKLLSFVPDDSTDPSKDGHSDSSFCSHGGVNMQVEQCGQPDTTLIALPELAKQSNEKDKSHEGVGPKSRLPAQNQIAYNLEDGIQQQRGMFRKRLQFESCDPSMVDKAEKFKIPSTSEPCGTPLAMERPSYASAESSIVSSNRLEQMSGSLDVMQRLPNHLQKIDGFVKNKTNVSKIVVKSAGIGLHLNSIGNAVSINSAADKQLIGKDMISRGKNSLTESKAKLDSEGPTSFKVLRLVKSTASSENQTTIAATNEHNLEENQTLRQLDSSNDSQAVVAAKIARPQPKRLIDGCITPCHMKTLAEIDSKLEESDQTSPRKKRRKPSEADGCKRCNCKKSKCLKLYCDCFAAGTYCNEDCACRDCFNKPEHEDVVVGTKQQIESRNPLAFAPKVVLRVNEPQIHNGDYNHVTPPSARHKRGCNCKKSKCLKKYCECYQAGVGCSLGCRCENCQNSFGRKEGFSDISEYERKLLQREQELKSTTEQELEENPTGKLQHPTLRTQHRSQQIHSHLSPLTPSLHDPSTNEPARTQFPASYYPSPESSASILPSFMESPSSPRILLKDSTPYEAREGSLSLVPFDHEQEYPIKIDPFSPGWDAFPEICNLSPLPNPSPAISASSSQSSSCKVLQTKLLQGSGRLSGGTLRWRSSPVTPLPCFGESKLVIAPDSETAQRSIVEDDTPEVLKDSLPPITTVKATSPNQKRVSPPHKFSPENPSSSPGMKVGRKYILHSMPSFPSLTPYSNKAHGEDP